MSLCIIRDSQAHYNTSFIMVKALLRVPIFHAVNRSSF